MTRIAARGSFVPQSKNSPTKVKKRRWRRALKFSSLALLALVVLAALFAVWRVRHAWPQVSGRIAVAGLGAPVEVVRDRWGVPHLFAQSERDLVFAQGYVHAQDRLWQMCFNRSVGSGRLSQLFGSGPLPADRYLRTIGLRRAAERDWTRLSAGTRALLQAYADGVNAFLTSHRGSLPVEFAILGVDPEPWTPVDSLTWTRAMSLNLSLNAPLETVRARLIARLGAAAARRLIPPYPADGPIIVPWPAPGPAPSRAAAGRGAGSPATGSRDALAAWLPLWGRPGLSWASNGWVIHGSRTSTGKPLLANDTHLGLGMPSVWYENGLHAAGGLNVVGFSFAGMPFVIMGQNGRIAWGITALNADVQDLYLEKLDEAKKPIRALFEGRWEPLAVVEERIPVKGGEPVELAVRSTRHGPLVQDVLPDWQGAPPMALAWAASDGNRLFDALAALDRAGSWQEFRQALSLWDTPSLNFVYADVDGNIGYQSTARVPRRAPGHDGTVPVPGWDGRAEWQGFIPFDEMPSLLNPADGFVVTANNRVVGEGYPHPLTNDWPPPDRARRISALLAAGGRVTPERMRQIQLDTRSQLAADLRPHLLAVRPRGEQQAAALARLRAWNLRFDPGEGGAAVFAAWLHFLLPEVFGDELGEELTKAAAPLVYAQTGMLADLFSRPRDPWFDDRGTRDKVETRDDVAEASLAKAVAWLAGKQGDDPRQWTWGRVHEVSLAHQPLGLSGLAPLEWVFNGETLEAPGGETTVNLAAGDEEHPFRVLFGTSQRFLADLADPARSLAVNSSGQSAHPFHPHRNDQTRLWSRGEYRPVLSTREAVRRDARETLTLVPR